MKIAVVSKADSAGGGASRVADDLNRLLNRTSDVRSTHFVASSGKGIGGTRTRLTGTHHKWISRMHASAKKRGFVEVFPFELPYAFARRLPADYDLIHFHDITTAYSPATLDMLSRFKPVVWTFHDCSPFTGGCLHPAPGCERYKDHCGDCPKLGSWPLDVTVDRTTLILLQKRRILRAGRIHCVAPSRWLADKAWESGNVATRPRVIPNGVDTTVFVPGDKAAARQALGLPMDRPIVLFAAGRAADVDKGAKTTAAVVRELADLNPLLLIVGKFSLDAARIYDGLDTKFIGYVESESELSGVYRAADLFLNFTTTDNLPLVVLETMASGLPCLAFRTGGIPEMIVDRETGVLVDQGDALGAVKVARELLASDRLPSMATHARARAVSEFSMDAFLTRHLELYAEVLGAPGRA